MEIQLYKHEIYEAFLHITKAIKLVPREYIDFALENSYDIFCNWNGVLISNGAVIVKRLEIDELNYDDIMLKVKLCTK